MKKSKIKVSGFAHIRMLLIIALGGLACVGTVKFAPNLAASYVNDNIITPGNASLQAAKDKALRDYPNSPRIKSAVANAPLGPLIDPKDYPVELKDYAIVGTDSK